MNRAFIQISCHKDSDTWTYSILFIRDTGLINFVQVQSPCRLSAPKNVLALHIMYIFTDSIR